MTENLLALILALGPSTITLDGQPLQTVIDPYRLVETVGQSEDDDEPRRVDGWQRGLGVGFIFGCAFGLYVLNILVEDAVRHLGVQLAACGSAGLFGAGVGAVVAAVVP